MRSAVLVSALLLACGVAAISAEVPKTQLPQMKQLVFEGWGFRVEVPRQSQKQTVPANDEVELTELHVCGEFIYLIRITKVAPNTLTSTAIEQEIQAEWNFASRLGPAQRWEMTSRGGELFKGTSHAIHPDEDMPDEAAVLKTVLKGRTGFICSSSAPVGDESSPILTVGVIGPKGRDSEVANMAKYFAYGVVKLGKKPSSPTKPAPPEPPEVTPPKPPASKPPPQLKKGQIEVSGVIASVASNKKSLVATVDQIRLPGGKLIKLDPPRDKKVILKSLPAGTMVGAKITAIGKDEGVGTPLKAEYVEVTPPPPARPPEGEG